MKTNSNNKYEKVLQERIDMMNSMSMAMSSSTLMTAPVSASKSGSPSATATSATSVAATGASLTIGNPIDSSFLFFPRTQESISLNQEPFNPTIGLGRRTTVDNNSSSYSNRLPGSNLPSSTPYSASGE